MSFSRFIKWEQATRDTIDVKKIYIDIAGDLAAGVMLSQILFWFLPNKQGKTKLRVKKNDELWLAKADNEWHDEIRLSYSSAKRARNVLKKKGLIECKTYRFNNTPKTHIKLNEAHFMKVVSSQLDEYGESDSTTAASGLDENVESLTETTTETTTETIAETKVSDWGEEFQDFQTRTFSFFTKERTGQPLQFNGKKGQHLKAFSSMKKNLKETEEDPETAASMWTDYLNRFNDIYGSDPWLQANRGFIPQAMLDKWHLLHPPKEDTYTEPIKKKTHEELHEEMSKWRRAEMAKINGLLTDAEYEDINKRQRAEFADWYKAQEQRGTAAAV